MRRAAALLGLCLLTGCAHVVRYTDELVQPQTGRSLLVRLPATFGAIVGFGVGLPIDIAALIRREGRVDFGVGGGSEETPVLQAL